MFKKSIKYIVIMLLIILALAIIPMPTGDSSGGYSGVDAVSYNSTQKKESILSTVLENLNQSDEDFKSNEVFLTEEDLSRINNLESTTSSDILIVGNNINKPAGKLLKKQSRLNFAPQVTSNINVDIAMEEPTDIKTDVKIEENKVKLVKEEPISTFSIDSDDGAYKVFKQQINYNNLPDKDFVRIEEFVNAFKYDYPSPTNLDKPFSTHLKIAKSPWNDKYLVLIGIKGYEYNIDTLPPVNLTFLIDVSGSMSQELPNIKTGLKMLVNKLRPTDRISLVTYAGATKTVLSNVKVEEKEDIINAINDLNSGGGTAGASGIKLAYKENKSGFIEGGVNRIILMSDGDFNVGVSNVEELKEMIKEKRKSGTTFSTVGIGGSNYVDNRMEQLANNGNGNYTYISNMEDAKEVFADNFISTIKNIAKDVKLQVEFNQNNVKEYRLIGYENRMLNKEDFKNDKVDAGEIPSGITTTAIYEITLTEQEGLYPDSRYDKKEEVVSEHSEELAFLKIRFKQPTENVSGLLTFPINKNIIDKNINEDNKFAINVAGFAQIYRDSDFISTDYNYDKVLESLGELDLDYKKEQFKKLVEMVKALKETK